jgi:hypothetical protein
MQNQAISPASPSPQAAGPRREFALILTLFIAFRVMALFAFRPGGQVLDFSDFYWYREFAQLTRQGYIPYLNLWTTYPPLFPFLMIGLWRISTLLPPWEFPNLWFSLLLGGTFLLFETGNLVLIYAIARRLSDSQRALRSAWFYLALFTPVYTLTGWFESYPLFFFLLSLYLLLRGRPVWSALTTGVGFMIKLIPLILLPVGARVCEHLPRRPGSRPGLSRTPYRGSGTGRDRDSRGGLTNPGSRATADCAGGGVAYAMPGLRSGEYVRE